MHRSLSFIRQSNQIDVLLPQARILSFTKSNDPFNYRFIDIIFTNCDTKLSWVFCQEGNYTSNIDILLCTTTLPDIVIQYLCNSQNTEISTLKLKFMRQQNVKNVFSENTDIFYGIYYRFFYKGNYIYLTTGTKND